MIRDYRTDITKRELHQFLRSLDSQLQGRQKKVKLYFVGGSKLALENVRDFSKDIDFIVSRDDWRAISGMVAEFEETSKIKIDAFPCGQMPNYDYLNYADNAKRSQTIPLDSLEVYCIDDADFLLTKALAGRDVDFRDVDIYFARKPKVSQETLRSRFSQVKPLKEKDEEISSRFARFVEEYYKEP
jgi:hypothetical protein